MCTSPGKVQKGKLTELGEFQKTVGTVSLRRLEDKEDYAISIHKRLRDKRNLGKTNDHGDRGDTEEISRLCGTCSTANSKIYAMNVH